MCHIDLMNNIATIKQPETKHQLFVLESEMLYLFGSYLVALERAEGRELQPQEVAKMLEVKLGFAKMFFQGFNQQIEEEQAKETKAGAETQIQEQETRQPQE